MLCRVGACSRWLATHDSLAMGMTEGAHNAPPAEHQRAEALVNCHTQGFPPSHRAAVTTLGRKLAAAVERGAALEEELAAVRGAAVEAGGLVTLLQGELDAVKAQACPSCQP